MLTILYAALTLFLAGNLLRIVRVALLPVHLRWDLYPMPHGSRDRVRYGGSHFEESAWWVHTTTVSRAREFRAILEEVFLLRTVWRHNRSLWLWSWLLHPGLYLMTAAFLLPVWGGVAGPGASPGLQPRALCSFLGFCAVRICGCLWPVPASGDEPSVATVHTSTGWLHLCVASPHATIDDWLDLPTVKTDVIAFTAQEAGDWVCDRVCDIPCVTLTVYGPKGGKAVHRYWGHDQAIWFGMQKATEGRQQEFMVNI